MCFKSFKRSSKFQALLGSIVLSLMSASASYSGQVDRPYSDWFALSDETSAADSTKTRSTDQGEQLKSESTALRLSLFGTLAPLPTIVLAVPALIAGPSLGYFYAGNPGRAWTGIGIRTVGVGAMISSFVICGWDCSPGDDNATYASLTFLGGASITVVSVVVDIASVKQAVRNHNAKLNHPNAVLAPAYFANTKSAGLELRIRF